MHIHCVFFHTILTMAQNIQRGNFTIFPESYSVVFLICVSPGMCFECPSGNRTESVHPIELSILKLLFCSKLYSDSEYTDTVLLFGLIPLALIIHISNSNARLPMAIIFFTFMCDTYEFQGNFSYF